MNKKRPTVLEWAVQEGIPCPALTIQQQAEEIARLKLTVARYEKALGRPLDETLYQQDWRARGDRLQGEVVAIRQALEVLQEGFSGYPDFYAGELCVIDAALASDAGAKEAAVIEAAKEWAFAYRDKRNFDRAGKAKKTLCDAVDALLGN